MTSKEQAIEMMAKAMWFEDSGKHAVVPWEDTLFSVHDRYRFRASAAYDALREAGLVVVPEEPTEAMLKAPRSSAVPSELRNLRQDYKAMIVAYTEEM